MKKVFLLAISAMLLFCSCEYLFGSRKDKLDRLVGAHWDAWKAEGKDTTMCFIDFAKVVPIEWDTMVYVNYYGVRDSEIIKDYMNNCYWPEKEKYRGHYTGFHNLYVITCDSFRLLIPCLVHSYGFLYKQFRIGIESGLFALAKEFCG